MGGRHLTVFLFGSSTVRDPCDVGLAIRLGFDCSPAEALEIQRAVADQFVGKNGKVSWTHKLVAQPVQLMIGCAMRLA